MARISILEVGDDVFCIKVYLIPIIEVLAVDGTGTSCLPEKRSDEVAPNESATT